MTERFNTFGYHNALPDIESQKDILPTAPGTETLGTPGEAPSVPTEVANTPETQSTSMFEGNSILSKISDGKTPSMMSENFGKMISKATEKIDAFGERRIQALKSWQEKGGLSSIFAPLTSGKDFSFKFVNLGASPEQQLSEIKKTTENDTVAAVETTKNIKAKVIEFPKAVTPETTKATRTHISDAVESNFKAYSEKFSYFQLATMFIMKMFKDERRKQQLKAAETLAASEDPVVAKLGKETIARLEPKYAALKRFRALYPNLLVSSERKSTETKAKILETLSEVPDPAAEVPNVTAENTTTTTPEFRDQGIETAFAMPTAANDNGPTEKMEFTAANENTPAEDAKFAPANDSGDSQLSKAA